MQLQLAATPAELSLAALLNLRRKFHDYVVCLKIIAERYVPLILGVALLLIFEQATPAHTTLTATANDLGKVASWFLLVPALGVFIVIVAFGYQAATDVVDRALSRFVVVDDDHLADQALVLRGELVWDHTPLEFIGTVGKSASVSAPALVAIFVWVVESLKSGWLSMFFPDALVTFFKHVYG